MTAVWALYAGPQAAQRAFDVLRASGIAGREIFASSSEPWEEFEFGRQDSETVMTWIAVGGAAAGLAGAYLLTSLTQRSWPIVTGGMPIFSFWTSLIVLFEMTMLGAILATVGTLLKTAGLFRALPSHYDPEVSRGRIQIGVRTADPVQQAEIERLLRSTEPLVVKTSNRP